jgi:hypothetical protein
MLLEQLLSDEIRRRQPRNLAQAKSFRELLEKTLQRYHNRLIDAATVVAEMLRMKREPHAKTIGDIFPSLGACDEARQKFRLPCREGLGRQCAHNRQVSVHRQPPILIGGEPVKP